MLEVVHGPVDARLIDSSDEGPIHQAARGRVLLDLPSIGRALIEGGSRATVARAPEAREEDLAWLIGGPVRQVAWLLCGTMALRAAGVVIGDRAVALIGRPAVGKSAVAAALALRGHRVLSDAVLPVHDAGDQLVVRGTADSLELWPAAVDELGLDESGGRVVRPALAKRAYAFPAADAAPLGAVVVLERRTAQGDPCADRLPGRAGLRQLARWTAMEQLVDPLGLREDHFRWVARVAGAVPVFHLRSDRHRRDLDAVAGVVEGVLE